MLIVRNHQPSWLLCPFSDMLQTTSILSCGEVASQLLIWSVVPLAMFVEVRPRSMSGFIAVSRKGRVQLQNRMIFWKSAKEGEGSFSIQKIVLQVLGTANRAFWSWNWYKIVMLFSTIVMYYNCITPITGNHVHAFHTIQPPYLLPYMQPYLS